MQIYDFSLTRWSLHLFMIPKYLPSQESIIYMGNGTWDLSDKIEKLLDGI